MDQRGALQRWQRVAVLVLAAGALGAWLFWPREQEAEVVAVEVEDAALWV